MAKVVNVHEAKARLSEVLERTKAGEEILIGKRGKPYAKLIPVEPLAGLGPHASGSRASARRSRGR